MTVQLGFKHSPISVNPSSPDIKCIFSLLFSMFLMELHCSNENLSKYQDILSCGDHFLYSYHLNV